MSSPQVAAADVCPEIGSIDPECVHMLYVDHHLDALVSYLNSIPGAAHDKSCKAIMELTNVSISGEISADIPKDVRLEWHNERAAYARDLARGCSLNKGSLSFQHLVVTSTPLDASSSNVSGCSPGCSEPATNIIIPHTVNEENLSGQRVQNIPLGSRYWDTRRSLLPDVEGLNPLRFYGPHPAWEKHAVPVEKDKNGKVKAFLCMYCRKVFSGNAADAARHLTGSSCKIPPDAEFILMDKIDEYLASKSDKRSIAKGRKATTGKSGLKILKKFTVVKTMNMLMDLSRNGDDIGDGISGVLVMARSLLKQTEKLLLDGIDFIKIAQGFETASKIAFDHLRSISQNFQFNLVDREPLVHSCMAALSAIDSKRKKALAQMVVEAVITIADIENMYVNLDFLKVHGKVGKVQQTELIKGIILEKEMSHPRMPNRIAGAKIALLACKSVPSIDAAEEPLMLHGQKNSYLDEMVKSCQSSGANLVISECNFDGEANDFLMHNNLAAIGGVTTVELESIAIATGGQIIPKLQSLSPDKLGKAEIVREVKFGRSKVKMVYIEKCANPHVTILLYGGTKKTIEETKRNIVDAFCVARNLILNNSVVCGAGSAEISCSNVVESSADGYCGAEQNIIRLFAHVLDAIPVSLAESSGLPPIETLSRLKSRHVKENNPHFGIDCNALGNEDMQVQQVFASVDSKMNQISLALKVLKLIFKDVT